MTQQPPMADRVTWRKSSRSGQNGECVEVGTVWRTSSRSAGNGACVEVAELPDVVAVRDSKDPDGPRLTFDPDVWVRFVEAVKSGRLDR